MHKAPSTVVLAFLFTAIFFNHISTNLLGCNQSSGSIHEKIKLMNDRCYFIEAEQMALETLHEAKRQGSSLEAVALAMEDVSKCYFAQKKYKDALSILQHAFDLRIKPTKQYDYFIIQNLRFKAFILNAEGKFAEADTTASEVFRACSKHPTPDQTNLAEAMELIGWIAFSKRDLLKADEMFRAALTTREKFCNINDPSLAFCLDQLAMINLSRNRLENARPYAERSKKIRRNLPEAQILELATSLEVCGMLEFIGGNAKGANLYYKESLDIRDKLMKKNSLPIDQALQNVCTSWLDANFHEKNESEQMNDLFKRWVSLRQHVYGETGPETIQALVSYGEFLEKIEKKEEARTIYQKLDALSPFRNKRR